MNRLVREFCVTNVNEYAPFDFAANQLSNNKRSVENRYRGISLNATNDEI